jgi:hypothetical protein
MGQCIFLGNLFFHVLRSGGCNKFYQQSSHYKCFTAYLTFGTFNQGKTSICTLSNNLVCMHSLEIALLIHQAVI